jgi:DNA invertase Pin-like site-specific DNA recombinase
MKHYFGYVRVSTAKQGQQGVSLQEQRTAIEQYAGRHNLTIERWYEEQVTAAKRGRPAFETMLRDRRRKKVAGVIVHKIDRSARNFFDWAGLNDLMDEGVEIHVASENRRIETRGDRLAADVQAVVAVDYIRNLREETIKGFYGRLKQGLYPLKAPVGYLDQGGGKAKTIDPIKGPLVRLAFERYATGGFTLDTLAATLERDGLRSRNGKQLTINAVWKILHNPFYMGIMRIERRGEHFLGVHELLVTKKLFDQVQGVLNLRGNRATLRRHDFLFRRTFTCATCGHTLYGERQKGRVYYRCHSKTCNGVSVREKTLDDAVREQLSLLRFPPEKERELALLLAHHRGSVEEIAKNERERVALALGQVETRLMRLTDAFIDGNLEKDIFERRKEGLLREQRGLLDQKAKAGEDGKRFALDRLRKFLELAKNALLSYEMGNTEEKRDLVRTTLSNCTVSGKNVVVELSKCYQVIAHWLSLAYGGLQREDFRPGVNLPDRPSEGAEGFMEKIFAAEQDSLE